LAHEIKFAIDCIHISLLASLHCDISIKTYQPLIIVLKVRWTKNVAQHTDGSRLRDILRVTSVSHLVVE